MFEDVITLVILILSIILHEVAHGYAANWLGDPTARLAGRLTVNPIPHIDPLGSVIVPAIMFFGSQGLTGHGFIFGWAKPVPYNPYNLRNQKWGESFVAAAGPLTNLLLAGIFSILIRCAEVLDLSPAIVSMFGYVVFINILLALFNSIPFPPLDGSKIIVPFLPFGIQVKYRALTTYMENLGLIALFLCVFVFMQVFWKPFSTVVDSIFRLMVGI